MSIAAPNCRHRAVQSVVSIGCSAITFPPLFFFSHRLPPKAVKRCPHIGSREMQRQVEDPLGPSFSRHVHPAASPTVKPESHDPPPLCAWGERDNGLGAEERQGAPSLRNLYDFPTSSAGRLPRS